jgi:hypothetical protein
VIGQVSFRERKGHQLSYYQWHRSGTAKVAILLNCIRVETDLCHRNKLTERLKLNWPIFGAPMGGFSPPALAAAVESSGGLGGLGMWGRTAVEVERGIAGFRQLSGGSLNVNYPLWENTGDLADAGEAMRAMEMRAVGVNAEVVRQGGLGFRFRHSDLRNKALRQASNASGCNCR